MNAVERGGRDLAKDCVTHQLRGNGPVHLQSLDPSSKGELSPFAGASVPLTTCSNVQAE